MVVEIMRWYWTTLWAQETFIEINDATVNTGDYGFAFVSSSGVSHDSDINVNCNGEILMESKAIQGVAYTFEVGNNEIETDEGSGITVYDGGDAELHNNAPGV